ncbi:MAG: hypothetical protein BGO21_27940 [Dyadobacter sp. 50-39]|uniref:hypothetical protein n=1 Tax=Dyadobacter sp. 50-39 TaxID=1895756 RepID=UPI00095B08C5|nr:hypothetical protein [Dyadobacter sp. 50-39]OJV16703.1 MAG: hypothetical protein BGO21_27940 [Dyadobacter sp. 50-39]
MNPNQDSLHTLNEIRSLMERSSKFLSLSGLSGVFAGIFALIGAGTAYVRFKTDWLADILVPLGAYQGHSRPDVIGFLLVDGICVLVSSLAVGIILTVRRGRKKGLTVWNGSSKRLLVAMLIPLTTGGIFCLAMLHYGFIWLVFPVTLLFYGLALVNASRFTYPEVFYMGISEIGIGCIALFLTGYSLIFWAIGFGLLHIVYGLTMYNRYEREKVPGDPRSQAPGGKSGVALVVLLLLVTGSVCSAQIRIPSDSTASKARKWYDRETIYLRNGNSFVKNNVLYTGQKALRNEFMVSPEGLGLYLKSRRTRSIGLVISLAGSAGSIVSLLTGNRDHLRTFFWVSVGTGLVGSGFTMAANNQRDQAVWMRNRDAMLFLEANQ